MYKALVAVMCHRTTIVLLGYVYGNLTGYNMVLGLLPIYSEFNVRNVDEVIRFSISYCRRQN